MLKGKLLKNVKAAFDAHAKGDEPAVAVEDLAKALAELGVRLAGRPALYER